ncbi:MAG: helix-turn-helix transcriptional regulator [Bacteroidetes bacterium]|nr:helix-turn-helix transcriptional regulator [Bacteroidota bacterium]
MNALQDIYLINQFPNFHAPGFDRERYDNIFRENNVIINAESSHVEYGDHWGPLSVKCAFNGREFYRSDSRTVAVDDDSFLIFNEGKVYSSYIRSETKVRSFTINFSPSFVDAVYASMTAADPDQAFSGTSPVRFAEQLYRHDRTLSPLFHRLRSLSLQLHANKEQIADLYTELLQRLFATQQQVRTDVERIGAVRPSTKQELHTRLHRAKDLIDSCFTEELTLDQIAAAAMMAPVHCLREYKKNFGCTPHQYLIRRRIREAERLLRRGTMTVSEVCLAVGYSDLSSFSKLFKSRTGTAPEQYRRRES